MGIQINGQTDNISATDGSLTVSGADLGSASASSLNISGIVTASGGFSGNVTGNINSTGVSTVTDLRVGTAVTANSNGIQVGAGKSIRIFGSASGYSDIIASSAAGASEILIPSTGGTLDRLNRAGNVLQVVQTVKTDTFSSSTNSYVDVTNLSVSITPSSASSKVLIFCSVVAGFDNDGNAARIAQFNLLRDSTSLINPDSPSSRTPGFVAITEQGSNLAVLSSSFEFLDSPNTTSAISYKIQTRVSAGTVYVNRSELDNDTTAGIRAVSTITAMEVAA
jgi:hypothetical protein